MPLAPLPGVEQHALLLWAAAGSIMAGTSSTRTKNLRNTFKSIVILANVNSLD
jgi:hypothetical protein